MRFRTILADPPWAYEQWSDSKNGAASAAYPTRDADWIAGLPVVQCAAADCVLLLWATNPKLREALRVVEAWGFDYRTMLTWVKMARAACPRVGIGFHLRGATEHILIATRGNVSPPPADRRPVSVIFNPIGAHSAKPEYQYDLAEMYPGPYLELFHRPRNGMFPPRPGWTFVGNEVDGQDIRDALPALAALTSGGVVP